MRVRVLRSITCSTETLLFRCASHQVVPFVACLLRSLGFAVTVQARSRARGFRVTLLFRCALLFEWLNAVLSTAHALCTIVFFGSKSCIQHDLLAQAADQDRLSALFRPSCSTATAEKRLANCVTCCQSERRFWGAHFGVVFWAAKSRTGNGHGLSVTKCCPPMSGRKSDPTVGPQKAPHFLTKNQSINRCRIMRVVHKRTGCIQKTTSR